MYDAHELLKKFLDMGMDIWQQSGETQWRLPTGVVSLDHLLGGGLPSGSIVQIHGVPKVGKTALAYSIISEAMKHNLPTVFAAQEKYDKLFAESCGVDTESSLFNLFSAQNLQTLHNGIISFFSSSNAMVVVVDSIANANSKNALDKKQPTDDMDKGPKVGERALLITDFLSKVEQPVRRKGGILVLINQLRSQIGPISYQAPAGGKALQYSVDVSLSLRPDNISKEEGGVSQVAVIIDKSRDFNVTQFGNTKIEIAHRIGIDKERNIIRLCEERGLVERAGAWYSFEGQRFQGLEGFAKMLKENAEIRQRLVDTLGVYSNLPEFPVVDVAVEESPKKRGKK